MASTEHDVAAVIGRLLDDAGMTLAVAESCTGGLVGHLITNIPGSSAYFRGSIAAYADDVKRTLLRVQSETLVEHGAVSEETAREMAEGARVALKADVGVSITGIAGPGGGTTEKPVGLVYVGLAAPDGDWMERHVFDGDRWENKIRSSEAALGIVRRYLEGRMNSESISVEAAFSAEGEVTPRGFDWQGSFLQVEGVGRRWTDAGQHCFNVMAMGGRLFELQFDSHTLRWSIARGPVPRLTA